MFFQLLVGTHRERDGQEYRVETLRDDKTKAITEVRCPVIQSAVNLTKEFGPDKFKPLSEAEGRALMSKDVLGPETTEAQTEKATLVAEPPVSFSSESEVAKAARAGAVGILDHPPGKDVTSRFASAAKVGLSVYRLKPGSYVVYALGRPVNTEPVERDAVDAVIEAYLESD